MYSHFSIPNWVMLIIICGSCAPITASVFDQTHEEWNKVLQEYVKDGRVNYQGLKTKPIGFNRYIAQLASVKKADFDDWTKEEKLAYWINAYNAYTVKAILDNYPVKSIKDIPGVWKKLPVTAGGEELTLDKIEHKKLREELKEPRIHFAINCASIGCPVLLGEAYRSDKLEAQFSTNIKAMLGNSGQFRLDRGDKQIYLSKILDWFGDDFKGFKGVNFYGSKKNGVVSFLSNYLPESDKKLVRSEKFAIKWLDYDWNLNNTEID